MIMVTGGRVGADDHGGRVPFQMPDRAVQTPVILAPAPAVKTPGPAPARNF
jgi:hypothetical protein